MGFGFAQALMAALLHDALEDCGVTKIELIERFGSPVAELVDGLTKLDKLHFSTKEESQAESFRKMLLAMARDVRVILIKLADRLHNMRTLHFIKSGDKRRRIAKETMDIYAPLAGRMGMQNVRDELEAVFAGLKRVELARLVIAYEPVWAIGAAVPMSARDMHEMSIFIKITTVNTHFSRKLQILLPLHLISLRLPNASLILSDKT